MFSSNNDDKKLDWMYKGATSLIDREDYLLGKSVDKTLEQAQFEEKQAQKGSIQPPKNHVEHECIPPSIRDYKQQIGEQVDLAAKLQEDPLVAIRKREEEARKKFLQNPVQLKKIQKALKEKDKKKKKSSKKKRKKRRKSSSDESDIDLDAKLAAKLLKFRTTGMGNTEDNSDEILAIKFSLMKDMLSEKDYDEIMEGKDNETDSEEEDVKSSEEDRGHSKYKSNKQRSNSTSSEDAKYPKQRNISRNADKSSASKRKYEVKHRNYKHKNDNSSSGDEISKESVHKRNKTYPKSFVKKNYFEYKKANDKGKYRKTESKHNDSSSDDDRSKDPSKRHKGGNSGVQKEHIIRRYNSDSDEIIEEKRNYGLVNADGSKLAAREKIKADSSKEKVQKKEEKSTYKRERRKPLTEEEKEKLRQEMTENAAWRCKDREKNLRKYREEDEKETIERKDYDPDFMQKQLIKSTKSSTVESRIKSNINNIQRSSNAMNSNFSRK